MNIDNMLVGGIALLALGGCVCVGGVENVRGESRMREEGGGVVHGALYVGAGALSRTTWHWLQIMTLAEGMETRLVDAETIRRGALDGVDVLVVPGGDSRTMSTALGEQGRQAIVDFVRQGGGYLGTCAGAYLVSETSPSHPNMLNLMPFTSRDGKGSAELLIRFNDTAKNYGIKPGSRRVTYGEGPVFEKVKVKGEGEERVKVKGEGEERDFEVLATYASSIATWTNERQPTMAGHAAVIAGRVGEGKIYAIAVHPEVDVSNHAMLRDGFRFLTGREITWKIPQRHRGDLCVGVDATDGFATIADAEAMRGLMRGEVSGVDLVAVTRKGLASGARRHLDVVIAPTVAGVAEVEKMRGEEKVKVKVRGEEKVKVRGEGEEKVKVKGEGEEKVRGEQSTAIRVATFADDGGVNFPVSERMALSPGFDVQVVSAADIRAGRLKDFQMLLMPGGWAPTQYKVLGTNGCEQIRRFIRDGGSLYAICAGAFLASQTVDADAPRGNWVPWCDLGDYQFRGWGPIAVTITDEGAKALGVTSGNRDIIYFGGPVFKPAATPMADCDVRPWGDYFGYNLNTCSTKELPPMAGHAAFLGGTVGKGKVFLSGPHPEKDETTFDIVDGAIRYLTGVKPESVNRNRTRGALSVAFPLYRNTAFARMYLSELLSDRTLDLRIGWSATDLKHLDVVVVMAPSVESFTPELREFAANGGTVIAVADTKARRAAVAGRDWVTVVPTISAIPGALGKL